MILLASPSRPSRISTALLHPVGCRSKIRNKRCEFTRATLQPSCRRRPSRLFLYSYYASTAHNKKMGHPRDYPQRMKSRKKGRTINNGASFLTALEKWIFLFLSFFSLGEPRNKCDAIVFDIIAVVIVREDGQRKSIYWTVRPSVRPSDLGCFPITVSICWWCPPPSLLSFSFSVGHTGGSEPLLPFPYFIGAALLVSSLAAALSLDISFLFLFIYLFISLLGMDRITLDLPFYY